MQVSHHTERLCPVLFQLAPEAKEALKKKKSVLSYPFDL